MSTTTTDGHGSLGERSAQDRRSAQDERSEHDERRRQAGRRGHDGDVALVEGAVRAVTPGTALRTMGDLAGAEPGIAVAGPAQRQHANAVAAILGQLTACADGVSLRVLAATTAVARQRRSLRGLEAVLLSALLGAPDDDQVAVAAQAWADHLRDADDRRFPLLHPDRGELVLTTASEVAAAAAATGGDLRAGLAALLRTGRAGPDQADDELHGDGLLDLGGAIACAAVAAASAGPGDPDRGWNERLPAYLHSGFSLQVDLVVGADHGAGGTGPLAPDPTSDDVLVPLFDRVALDTATPTLTGHPWSGASACRATLVDESSRRRLVLRNGTSCVLGPLPRLDAFGRLVRRGPLLPDADDGGRSSTAAPGRAGNARGETAPPVVVVPRPGHGGDGGAIEVPFPGSGVVLDPLTGRVVHPVTGLPIGPAPHPDGPLPIDERQRLVDRLVHAVDVLGIPLETTLIETCRLVADSELLVTSPPSNRTIDLRRVLPDRVDLTTWRTDPAGWRR